MKVHKLISQNKNFIKILKYWRSWLGVGRDRCEGREKRKRSRFTAWVPVCWSGLQMNPILVSRTGGKDSVPVSLTLREYHRGNTEVRRRFLRSIPGWTGSCLAVCLPGCAQEGCAPHRGTQHRMSRLPTHTALQGPAGGHLHGTTYLILRLG